MKINRLIVLVLIICLVPVAATAKVYRYIDADGVERFSNQPPPEGAKIIGEKEEIKYDKAADSAQQERNRDAAAEAASQPPPAPVVKQAQPSTGETVTDGGDGNDGEKEYSRRKHRRKKEIRKEQAEARKAAEAVQSVEKK